MAGVGLELAVWTIHRRIGMSGGLMANAILRETGHAVTADEAGRLLRLHADAYARLAGTVRPLPGARELLSYLTRAGVPWAIATSGRIESARPTLESLGVGPEVTIITRHLVQHAKPDPDMFLAAAERLRGGPRQPPVSSPRQPCRATAPGPLSSSVYMHDEGVLLFPSE